MGIPTNSVSGKDRVRSALTYKKPVFWLPVFGIVASIVLAICFLTNSPRQRLEDVGTLSVWKNGKHLYTWTSDGETFATAGEVKGNTLEMLLDLDLATAPLSHSQSPDRDKSHTLILQTAFVTTEYGHPSGLYERHIHFSSDFTSVWVDDGIEPTATYKVTEARKARELYERIEQDNYPVPPQQEQTTPVTDIASLKAKFPMYFDLDTSNGLALYFWSLDSYGLSTGNSEYNMEELLQLYGNGATEEEMFAILSHYLNSGEITRDDISERGFYTPVHSQVSAYDGDYIPFESYRFWHRYDSPSLTEYGAPSHTIEGNVRRYDGLTDGRWTIGKYIYKYRLEISGRMPEAEADTTYVYLSNLESIPFEEAVTASTTEAYFSPEEAVLVEINTATPHPYIEIQRNEDFSFNCTVYDQKRAVLYRLDRHHREPKILEVSPRVYGLVVQTGTGPSTNWAVFFDVVEGTISEKFNYVLDAKESHVLCGWYEDRAHSIIVRDIFDQTGYYAKIHLETESPLYETIIGGEFTDANTVLITHYTGDPPVITEKTIHIP